MKIRVYYNLHNVDNDDFATLSTICCNENELSKILRWIQCYPLTEFVTLEVIPE